MATLEDLERRLNDLEATLGTIAESMELLRKVLPMLNGEGMIALEGVAQMLEGIAKDGIRTPQLTIVNQAGEPVINLEADSRGGGTIGVSNGQRIIATLQPDEDRGGMLVLGGADGKTRVGVVAVDGAYRLNLVNADGDAHMASFGQQDGGSERAAADQQ